MLLPAHFDSPGRDSRLHSWASFLDLSLVGLSGSLLIAYPRIGPWPLALAALGCCVRLLVHRRLTRPTSFDLPIALFLVSAFVSASLGFNQQSEWAQGADWSAYHGPLNWAWGKFYVILAAVALYYSIANLPRPHDAWKIVQLFALLGLALTLFFVTTHDWGAASAKFGLSARTGQLLSRLLPELPMDGLFPNAVGSVIAWTLPFVATLVGATRSWQRLAWLMAGLIGLVGVWLSETRAVWLILLAVAPAWLAMRAIAATRVRRAGDRRAAPSLRIPPAFLVALGVLLILAGLFSLLLFGPKIMASPTVQSRLEVFSASWLLMQDYLFTGGGLGGFPMLYSSYYLLIDVLFLPYSHNLFLDLVIEQGIVAFVSAAWFALLFLTVCLQALSRQESITLAPSGRRASLVLAAAASLTVMVLHAQVEDILFGTRALLIALVPAALLVTQTPRQTSVKRSLTIGLIVLMAVSISVTMLLRGSWRATWEANLGALTQARQELAEYRGTARGAAKARSDVKLTEAERYFQSALGSDPTQRTARQRLAMIAVAQGRPTEARDHLLALQSRRPLNPTESRILAMSYLALGARDAACDIEREYDSRDRPGAWRFAERVC